MRLLIFAKPGLQGAVEAWQNQDIEQDWDTFIK
jgi:hypothetical protein